MIGLFYQSKSPPLIRELPLNDSLARSGVVGVPDPLALGSSLPQASEAGNLSSSGHCGDHRHRTKL